MTNWVAGRRWQVAGGCAALLIILGIAAVVLFNASMRIHADRDRAAALRDDLAAMRKGIRDYRASHGHYPSSLADLVPDYLRTIPSDPVTHAQNWRMTIQESVTTNDFSSSAPPTPTQEVVDVHSSAPGNDPDGRAWSDY